MSYIKYTRALTLETKIAKKEKEKQIWDYISTQKNAEVLVFNFFSLQCSLCVCQNVDPQGKDPIYHGPSFMQTQIYISK